VATRAPQIAAELAPTSRKLPGLSIILPCFNEEANVAQAIAESLEAGQRFSERFEAIVVDDGSTDATATIAGGITTADRAVRLVVHPFNRGYGAALRSGIQAAEMPWVLLTDADLQFDLADLEEFLPLTDGNDLLVGHRIRRSDPLGRRAAAAGWNFLVRQTFDLPVHDVDCAFKLVRRDLLEHVELVSSGAMISTELIARCLKSGAHLQELGVHHRPRTAGEQSGTNPRVVVRAFRELFELRHALRPTLHAS